MVEGADGKLGLGLRSFLTTFYNFFYKKKTKSLSFIIRVTNSAVNVCEKLMHRMGELKCKPVGMETLPASAIRSNR